MQPGIQDPRHDSHGWPAAAGYVGTPPNPMSNTDPSSRHRYQPYGPSSSFRPPPGPSNSVSAPTYDRHSHPPLPTHNEVEMTRDMLTSVLEYFSQLLPQHFDWNVVQDIAKSTAASSKAASLPISLPQPRIQGMRLVVHGGACMLLHPGLHSLSQQQQKASPGLQARTKTRDVDYIHRGFLAEYGKYIPDAEARLRECIQATARKFNLGADWMNSDADIALPMAHDPTDRQLFDPIYTASVNPQNIALHTIYHSSNGFLTLISVTPFWAVSLKLVRYTKWDAGDICLLLRNGTILSKTQWTPETLEGWLLTECWAMGYHNFDSQKKAQMRQRIDHAIKMLAEWTHYVSSGSSPPSRRASSGELAAAPQGGGRRAPVVPVIPDGRNHVGQWDIPDSREGRERERPPRTSKSRSRNASRAPSRKHTPEQEEFVPPGLSDDDDFEQYAAQYGDGRRRTGGYAPPRPPPQEQSAWGAPARGRVHTIRDPLAPPHPYPAHNGVPAESSAGAPPWGNGRPGDPYSMRILDQAIGGVPQRGAHERGRGDGYAGVGAGYQQPPVIPVIPMPETAQQQQRRRAEKQRKVERQRARGSKWRSMSETESDLSDGEFDDEGDKENYRRDQRHHARTESAAAKAAQASSAWHQLYEPATMGRSTSGQQPQVQPPTGMYAPRGQERAGDYGQSPFVPRPSDPLARPASRTRSKSSDNKHRPPPLDMGPPPQQPFIPPGAVEPQDPALLAQLQFEEQAKKYNWERQQQQLLAERENRYYQTRTFKQVPAAGAAAPPMYPHQHPHAQMQMNQMQMNYQQQQQQPHQMHQYPQQMQAQQHRGIYR